jgi:hypothetical protein
MHDILGPGTILGYCTNVHSGATLADMTSNLERFALAVKQRVSPKAPMGVGLWFSAATADELLSDPDGPERLKDWLEARGLLVYTLNGFPHGDFHQQRVKYEVYLPDWSHPERVEYTLDLIEILHRLLPEAAEGSISTLPVGWRDQVGPGWADHLGGIVDALADLHAQTGRIIHLDIEPEPGCEIADTVDLFTILTVFEMHEKDREALRRHLRVCLDVCHGAVMFEPPLRMLEWFRESRFHIGKVQLSSALRAPFAGRAAAEKKAMRAALERFVEPRYLHQTTIGTKVGCALKDFYDDLPSALQARKQCGYEWRVHFHVPLFLERIGPLETSRQDVIDLLAAIRPEDGIAHYEVETYAWDVLPPELRTDDLADGIARELLWVKELARTRDR